MATLNTHVQVGDTWYGPKDGDLPATIAAKISNPKVWADQAPDADQAPAVAPAVPPPHSGKGSGKAAWVDYATSQGVTVPTKATRDDIVDLLVADGIDIGQPKPGGPDDEDPAEDTSDSDDTDPDAEDDLDEDDTTS